MGRLLSEQPNFAPLLFKPHKRLHLRNILFNNEEIYRLAERQLDSETAWKEWLQWMADHAKGVHSSDFSYLKERFHSFQQFAALVARLRESNVEPDGNKRWTSRFIFPFGSNALYEDTIIVASGAASRDYINFGRTGELLYLMLCRCASAEALRPYLANLFEGNHPCNDLLRLMQRAQDDEQTTRKAGYLPYRRHESFDRLGADWLRICQLGLPGFDFLPHLVTLGALHIVLYQLQLAAEWSGRTNRPRFVCEVVAPKKTLVRELSAESYLNNNLLSAQAVEAYINRIEQSDEWRQSLNEHGAFLKCRELLEKYLGWTGDDYEGPSDPRQMMVALREAALKGHRQHTANVHRSYGREMGLVSKRGTNKLRYAPTDALLKTLLLTNVERRMELGEFLALLYARYGFVIGECEAERALAHDEFDKKAFQANAQRLEQRLGSLGMLRRLSDGCAYVENPYSQQ
ncbi:MAG TPA: hypothetical protein PLD20_18210 [Blastocatellia bacterium]|nr:hypothetical protein [Blastocatellia bacterium]